MAYSLPSFNLSVNDWYISNDYTDFPSTTVMGNLSSARRTNIATFYDPADSVDDAQGQWLLTPKGSEFGSVTLNYVDPDVVEVPSGSGLIYLVIDTLYVARGFPNEHVANLLIPLTAKLKSQMTFVGISVGVWPDFPLFLPA